MQDNGKLNFGEKLETHILNWVYFSQLYFLGLFFVMALSSSISVHLIVISGIIAFFGIGVILYFMRTKYILYEDGILVIQSGKRNFWHWEQLTDFEDRRMIFMLYGFINIGSIGNLRFRAGEAEAFSIGVMTADLDTLIEQYQFQLAEKQLYAKIDRLDKGKELYFPYLTLSQKGMEAKGQLILWGEISDVKFKRRFNGLYSIIISTQAKNSIKVGKGKFNPSNVFVVMGIVDFMLGTKKIQKMQRVLVTPHLRLWQTPRLIKTLLFATLMLFLYFSVLVMPIN